MEAIVKMCKCVLVRACVRVFPRVGARGTQKGLGLPEIKSQAVVSCLTHTDGENWKWFLCRTRLVISPALRNATYFIANSGERFW